MRQLTIVFVCGWAALGGCGKGAGKAPPPPPPRPVEVLAVAPAELRSTGEYLGSLLSRGSVIVLPQVAGYVRAIHVSPGQKVAANDPIVEIDAREENAALSSASAEAESAKARLGLAQQQLTRAEALYKEGLATAQEIDQRRADVAAATAAVRAAGAQVSQRQVALSYRAIRAPIPGEVGDVTVRLGDYVTPTTPVTTIAKAQTLELSVSVPASRARTLHLGAPLEVLADDGSVAVASAVSFIAPEVDPKTQLVEIKATFANDVGLRPRELVRVRIVYELTEALQVPLLAIQPEQPGVRVRDRRQERRARGRAPADPARPADRARLRRHRRIEGGRSDRGVGDPAAARRRGGDDRAARCGLGQWQRGEW